MFYASRPCCTARLALAGSLHRSKCNSFAWTFGSLSSRGAAFAWRTFNQHHDIDPRQRCKFPQAMLVSRWLQCQDMSRVPNHYQEQWNCEMVKGGSQPLSWFNYCSLVDRLLAYLQSPDVGKQRLCVRQYYDSKSARLPPSAQASVHLSIA
jgi:hypothetical protein